MGIIGNDSTLFENHRANLEREMYTEQPLRTGRLVEDMRGNHRELLNK